MQKKTLQGAGSVVLREHEREHAGGLLWVGRIFRPVLTQRVVQVDFPKELPPDEHEAPKVMLPVRVVILREPVEGRDLYERVSLHAVWKGVNTRGHHHPAASKCLAKGVIEYCDLICLSFGSVHILARVRRHVSGTAVRTVVVTCGEPLVRPLLCAAGTFVVIAEPSHLYLRLATDAPLETPECKTEGPH